MESATMFIYLWGSDSQREGLVAKVSEHMDISWVTTDSENLYRAERVERQLGQLDQDFCWVIVLHPGSIIITLRPVLYIIVQGYKVTANSEMLHKLKVGTYISNHLCCYYQVHWLDDMTSLVLY